MPDAVAISICNEHFSVSQFIEVVRKEAGDSEELRGIERAIERVRYDLGEEGVEYRDLRGQLYDVGRRDFEAIGSARPVPGLEREVIGLCIRPVVTRDGRILQTARGEVHGPPE
jgi:hypothetical protein